ncbi:MAG: Glutathionylspermidine synthase [Patescibacteria group bacterium]|nr:Glutathionylspermidine synthase [Patescibacteria group bacterium]
MKRIQTTPRADWQKLVEDRGFGFHANYWNESAYYQFSMEEVLRIERATKDLWGMCLEAVQHVIDNKLYHLFAIPEAAIPMIERSWNGDHPAIYGRFDFGYDGKNLKMFEFNADTPTSLFEAAIVQWYWLQDIVKDKDQFNSAHEKLVDYWKYLKGYLKPGILHFACIKGSLEDLTTVEYLRDCAIQGGLETKLVFMDDIGWDPDNRQFVDMDDQPITNMFKLYPWEWMVREDFASQIMQHEGMFWIEPSWKMILSNKAILPILWKLFPKCPYILEAYFEKENTLASYAKKPILSREGANIQLVRDGNILDEKAGDYGAEGFVCQELFDIPTVDGKTPIIGSWIIGQEPAGMGIREDSSAITGNTSCFVPHLIEG